MDQKDRQIIVKHVKMPDEMQQHVIDTLNYALNTFNKEKDVQTHIKKQFDLKYKPSWHCIVGRNYNFYMPQKIEYLIQIYVGYIAVLLLKGE